MRIVSSQPARRGSQKWLQAAVRDEWSSLDLPLCAKLPGASRIDWLSPIASDDFAEYRDAAFLQRLGLDRLVAELPSFWPRRGPQWDGLARSDAGHVLVVEAKAHVAEFCSPPSEASTASLSRIMASLREAAGAMNVKPAALPAWGSYFYQYTNRLAHLHWLRSQSIDAKLVLVSFVGDEDMDGPMTYEAWEAAYLVADHVLGIPRRNALSAHILHVFPDVRKADMEGRMSHRGSE